jgi:hypothetical protein
MLNTWMAYIERVLWPRSNVIGASSERRVLNSGLNADAVINCIKSPFSTSNHSERASAKKLISSSSLCIHKPRHVISMRRGGMKRFFSAEEDLNYSYSFERRIRRLDRGGFWGENRSDDEKFGILLSHWRFEL